MNRDELAFDGVPTELLKLVQASDFVQERRDQRLNALTFESLPDEVNRDEQSRGPEPWIVAAENAEEGQIGGEDQREQDFRGQAPKDSEPAPH